MGSSIDKLKAQLMGEGSLKKQEEEHVVDTGEPVELQKATHLYQPVKGSSSTYFMVASGPDLYVAARYFGNALSVRYEGPALSGDAGSWLLAAGFSKKPNGHYSIHVDVASTDTAISIAQRTLASLLAASMYPFKTPMPSIVKVKKCCQQKSYGL